MLSNSRLLVLSLSTVVVLATAHPAEAVLFQLEKIAGTGTELSTGVTTSTIGLAQLAEEDGTTVTFFSTTSSSPKDGVYSSTGVPTAFTEVVTTDDIPIFTNFAPRPPGHFGGAYITTGGLAGFNQPTTLFTGSAGGPIFSSIATGDLAPGRTDGATFGTISVSNADNGFGGASALVGSVLSTDPARSALYIVTAETLGAAVPVRVVDNQTPSPDSLGTLLFTGGRAIDRTAAGTDVYFTARRSDFLDPESLFRYSLSSGTITRLILDFRTQIVPGELTDVFSSFNPREANEGAVISDGRWFIDGLITPANLVNGLYLRDSGGSLSTIADTRTLAPGAAVGISFSSFGEVSYSQGNVAFVAGTPGAGLFPDFGLYTTAGGGELVKIVREGDLIDGLTVTGVTLTSEALVGNSIAFQTEFNNGTTAVFRADVLAGSSLLVPLAPSMVIGNSSAFTGLDLGGANGLGTIDPLFTEVEEAIGYEFVVDAGQNFNSIFLPDGGFDLFLFDGSNFLFESSLMAGETFAFDAGGVSRFLLRATPVAELLGLSSLVAAAVAPTFVSGVTFVGDGTVDFSIIGVPEPAAITLMALMLAALTHSRIRVDQ